MSSLTLYSFPVPLGRRGSLAAFVLGAHVLLGFGLWMTMRYIQLPNIDEERIEIDLPDVKKRFVEPRAPTDPGTGRIREIDMPDPPPVIVLDELPTGSELSAATGTGTAGGQYAGPPLAVLPARLLESTKPAYPASEIRAEHEGVVLVRVLVGADGRVRDAVVGNSSGFPALDAAALAAVKRWKYAPSRRGDQAIEAWLSLNVVFRLER